MNTDARVRYTRKRLQSAFMESLAKKPLHSITVRELCDMAEINRSTFYKHYRDCYDLLEQMQREEVEQFEKALSVRDKFGREVVEVILDVLEQNRAFNETLIRAGIADHLRSSMLRRAHDLCIEDWRRHLPRADEQEVEMLFSALAAAILQITVSEYGRYDRDSAAAFAGDLLESCTRPYR